LNRSIRELKSARGALNKSANPKGTGVYRKPSIAVIDNPSVEILGYAAEVEVDVGRSCTRSDIIAPELDASPLIRGQHASITPPYTASLEVKLGNRSFRPDTNVACSCKVDDVCPTRQGVVDGFDGKHLSVVHQSPNALI